MDERQRLNEIAAAWEVWGERQHEVRRLVRTNEWGGDMTGDSQRALCGAQLRAQLAEAYARSRVQSAISLAVDACDTVPAFDEHWRASWGDQMFGDASREWAERFREALARATVARAGAAKQSAALAELDPAPVEAAPTMNAPPKDGPWWRWRWSRRVAG